MSICKMRLILTLSFESALRSPVERCYIRAKYYSPKQTPELPCLITTETSDEFTLNVASITIPVQLYQQYLPRVDAVYISKKVLLLEYLILVGRVKYWQKYFYAGITAPTLKTFASIQMSHKLPQLIDIAKLAKISSVDQVFFLTLTQRKQYRYEQ